MGNGISWITMLRTIWGSISSSLLHILKLGSLNYEFWISFIHYGSLQFSCSVLSDFETPWTAARQASLSNTNSQSLLKLTSIKSVMPSNHLILCCPLLLLPSIFPNIRVFSIESVLCIKWPKYYSESEKWKWSRSVVSNSLRPRGLQPTRLLCPWDAPGKNTGVGCHSLLQGIFPTQGSNPGLSHCRQILEQPGKPSLAMCVSALVTHSCPILCNPLDYSPPGSSVHGMLQARILE